MIELSQKKWIEAILQERTQQDLKWGTQDHDLGIWGAILGEEVGELSSAILSLIFDGSTPSRVGAIEDELVQIAAVALAILECSSRNRWGKPE